MTDEIEPTVEEIDAAIDRALATGAIVQVDVLEEHGNYMLWTRDRAEAAGVRIVPHVPATDRRGD